MDHAKLIQPITGAIASFSEVQLRTIRIMAINSATRNKNANMPRNTLMIKRISST
jgi:hypothetical protein